MINYENFRKVSVYGIPKEDGGDSAKNDAKMEDCVAKVMKKGHSKESAIKICKASLGFTKDGMAAAGPSAAGAATGAAVPASAAVAPPVVVPEGDAPAPTMDITHGEAGSPVETGPVPHVIFEEPTGRPKKSHTEETTNPSAPPHTHCIHCKRELHREKDCPDPRNCSFKNHLQLGHYIPANIPILGETVTEGSNPDQMTTSVTDKESNVHPVCPEHNGDYDTALSKMFSGDPDKAKEGEEYIGSFAHEDYRDMKHPKALIGQGKNSHPPVIHGIDTPSAADFKLNPDRESPTLGQMDELTLGALKKVRSSQEEMLSAGASIKDVREKFTPEGFFSGKEIDREDKKGSGKERDRITRTMLGPAWGGSESETPAAGTTRPEPAPEAEPSAPEMSVEEKRLRSNAAILGIDPDEHVRKNLKTTKEGHMTDSVGIEEDTISEASGGRDGTIPWLDCVGRVAQGINPETCEKCSRPMSLHNKWETSKQSNVEVELETPEMVYEALAEHLEADHDRPIPGRYASEDDDLIIDYLYRMHGDLHKKSTPFVNSDLLDLTSHPTEGDTGTWNDFQASGEPNIADWAASRKEEDHERADKAAVKGEEANNDTFKLDDHPVDKDGHVEDIV